MIKFLKAVALCVALAPMALFAGHPAEDMVKKLTDDLLTTLQNPQSKVDEKFLSEALERDVLPHIDFDLMTKLAIGKNWKKSSKEQRSALVSEFRSLLVKTYTKALSEYSGQKQEFLPFKPDAKRDDRAVVCLLYTSPSPRDS